ncbi:MAG: hypothetical protein WBD20_25575 [Pirellulaceae bacterium]
MAKQFGIGAATITLLVMVYWVFSSKPQAIRQAPGNPPDIERPTKLIVGMTVVDAIRVARAFGLEPKPDTSAMASPDPRFETLFHVGMTRDGDSLFIDCGNVGVNSKRTVNAMFFRDDWITERKKGKSGRRATRAVTSVDLCNFEFLVAEDADAISDID